ncbi:amidase domain-containing protein [Rathayibacter tanaceti]|uniref:Amidase-like protein n=2 Tax=Rathayibacter tanaceti TaxID=1671680 RepID=A0ACD2XNZ1_9MICO|nr:amidase domain-containing protein [Rathayibacter tanaceti]KZX21090.1 putative amidase domain protein [Rathayibacter tanaceti]QHC55703.1 hypothetical protein GSU10_08710 [Rathayibacter tanaceti]TCO39486.1 putative amidase-like protein [Rathayibacter tanaceti]
MQPYRLLTLGLTLAGIGGILFTPATVMASPLAAPSQVMVTAILSDIEHRNAQLLVDGAAQASAFTAPGSTSTRTRSEAIALDDDARRVQRDLFVSFGEDFTHFTTTIALDSATFANGYARIEATETTTMSRTADENGTPRPDYSYSFPQTIDFVDEHGTWLIDTITHNPTLTPADLPETIAPPSEITESQRNGTTAAALQHLRDIGHFASQSESLMKLPLLLRDTLASSAARSASPGPFVQTSTWREGRPPSLQNDLSSSYQENGAHRDAIVDYALKYAMQRNPNYKTMDDDCTNFVSQALVAGGWKQVYGAQDDERAWFGNNVFESRTWSTAQPMFDWGFHTAGNFKYVTSFTPGDITFWVWSGSYSFDHSTVVTYVDSDGQPYFTEHTNDHVNKSLTAILSENPGAVYSNWAP